MQRTAILCMTVAAWSLIVSGGTSLAQHDHSPTDPTPRSSVGGYTGQALRQLYRSDIGTGYTVAGQNSIALQGSTSRVPYVGQSTTSYGRDRERLDLGISSSSREKPFANVSSRPAVSPYMNLFREDFDGNSDFNYQTLVRPQVEQQKLNQQFEDQAQALSRRVQQISAQTAYDPRGSQSQYPTGHQTVFGYYGRYYPSMSTRGR